MCLCPICVLEKDAIAIKIITDEIKTISDSDNVFLITFTKNITKDIKKIISNDNSVFKKKSVIKYSLNPVVEYLPKKKLDLPCCKFFTTLYSPSNNIKKLFLYTISPIITLPKIWSIKNIVNSLMFTFLVKTKYTRIQKYVNINTTTVYFVTVNNPVRNAQIKFVLKSLFFKNL